MRTRGIRLQVLSAIDTGRCNTSRDVADEAGLSIEKASKCLHALAADGIIAWTERVIPTRTSKARIFEVVA